MGISIRRIGAESLREGKGASHLSNAYEVVDHGREFVIVFRSHSHGCTLGLEGQQGFLYVDGESNTVRKQVITVGNSCGISIQSDDVVDGLSPQAIRGVIMAERRGKTREISINGGPPEVGSD